MTGLPNWSRRLKDRCSGDPAVIVEPGEQHWEILRQLLLATQARGPRVADAHLAALAVEHGATLCTTDRDFHLFPRLRLENPLETAD